MDCAAEGSEGRAKLPDASSLTATSKRAPRSQATPIWWGVSCEWWDEVLLKDFTISTDRRRRKPITVARRYTDKEVSYGIGI